MSVFKKGQDVTRLKEILATESHLEYQNFCILLLCLPEWRLPSSVALQIDFPWMTENMTTVNSLALYLRTSTTQSKADLFSSNSKILEENSIWINRNKEMEYHLDPFSKLPDQPLPNKQYHIILIYGF